MGEQMTDEKIQVFKPEDFEAAFGITRHDHKNESGFTYKEIIERSADSANSKFKLLYSEKMTEHERLKFWIHLLEMEVQALRSVLSEFDGDKNEFTQWHKAQTIDQLKNCLVHP